jgi:hypothetical protein
MYQIGRKYNLKNKWQLCGMYSVREIPNDILAVTDANFEAKALAVFAFQYRENKLYRAFCDAIRKTPQNVDSLYAIPFLPIRFFKTHDVYCGSVRPAHYFESSGTTGSINSKHYVADLALYEQSFFTGFEQCYGAVSNYCILGLLPSYLERQHASLAYMTEKLIQRSGHPMSGFYLYDVASLHQRLIELEAQQQPTLLIGVSFALLDLAEKFPLPLRHTIIMETGGMKGRKKELTRMELHDRLKAAFQVEAIHSEYGMTELLSQAYARHDGLFETPNWMKLLLRPEDDPLDLLLPVSGRTQSGAINIIDLANLYSCSFIATDDLGRQQPTGKMEILGRLDQSDLRGCSLLVV